MFHPVLGRWMFSFLITIWHIKSHECCDKITKTGNLHTSKITSSHCHHTVQVTNVRLTRLDEIFGIFEWRWLCRTGCKAACAWHDCRHQRRRWCRRLQSNPTCTVLLQTLHTLLFQLFLNFIDFFSEQVVVFLLSQMNNWLQYWQMKSAPATLKHELRRTMPLPIYR